MRSGQALAGVMKPNLIRAFDPAWGVALNGECFIVGGAIPVVFALLEHEVDGSENLVADGDDWRVCSRGG